MVLSRLTRGASRSLLALIFLMGAASGFAQDLSPAQVLEKHLAATGADDKRNEVRTALALGVSEFVVKVPYSKSAGKAMLAGDGGNIMLVSSFDLADYPFEKIGFFSNKASVPFVRPGFRSPLGSYLLLNDRILSEGLFAGSILPSWRFLDATDLGQRLGSAGRKKIGGRETLVLSYVPKGGFTADSSVKLYFDAKDFRHLRTEYRQKIPSRNLYPSGIFSAQTGDNTNLMIEEFGDHRQVDGLKLPHSYNITLTIDGQAGTNEFRWSFLIREYRINQQFAADFFSFEK